MPALVQKVGVIYYLKSLCPIEVPPQAGPLLSLLAVNFEPVSPIIAIPGLLLFTVVVLVIAGLQVRRMEINYGSD